MFHLYEDITICQWIKGCRAKAKMCDPPPLYADPGLWFETINVSIMIPHF